LIIPEFGPHVYNLDDRLLCSLGQQKLADSRVLIVGCGGLGCPAAVYLAAAGVSRLTLVDDDVVEISNLHRQVMHSEEKVGTPKVESLAERLRSINHHVNITTHNVHLTNQNACEIIAGFDTRAFLYCLLPPASTSSFTNSHDVVLDCTDNVATRYLLNDACAACGPIPLVSGSALRLDGQLTVYLTAQPPSRIAAAPDAPKRDRKGEDEGLMKRRTPCYRCIHPIPPPAASVQGCSDAGVIGVGKTLGLWVASLIVLCLLKSPALLSLLHLLILVPGIIGTMQAAETIKILTGIGGEYLLCLNLLGMLFEGSSEIFHTNLETLPLLPLFVESIAGRLFIMDMAKNTTRSVELRKPRPDCKTCAPSAQITPEIVKQTDYLEFCGAPNCDVVCSFNSQIHESLVSLATSHLPFYPHFVATTTKPSDGRYKDNSRDIPLPELYRDSNLTQICSHIRDAQPPNSTKPYPVILICRRGNKSHSTANLLASALEDMLSRANLQSNPDLFALANGSGDISVSIVVRDVAGGLQAWSEKIDPNFPHY
uniref:ThiF domain-containing protein n=1 Tax=Schistocephalus solidus TaxID=70667 RepID=A0A183SU01_SCHSO